MIELFKRSSTLYCMIWTWWWDCSLQIPRNSRWLMTWYHNWYRASETDSPTEERLDGPLWALGFSSAPVNNKPALISERGQSFLVHFKESSEASWSDRLSLHQITRCVCSHPCYWSVLEKETSLPGLSHDPPGLSVFTFMHCVTH